MIGVGHVSDAEAASAAATIADIARSSSCTGVWGADGAAEVAVDD